MTDRNLGEVLDDLYQIREERRDLEKQVTEVKARYKEAETEAMEIMNRLGIDKASGEFASASLSETEIPSVNDWTKLMRFIKREGALYLFERRIAKSAWQELVANRKGRPIPGVESFTRVGLNLRTR